MSKFVELTDDEIYKAIANLHKWELRQGVLYCFGIKPESFNWEAWENQNSNPMRVYNWCCTILNGGEHKYSAGQTKLSFASKTEKDSQRFEVLRDILVDFCFQQWPEFTKRTYTIWKAYREERDGKAPDKSAALVLAVARAAIAEYRGSKKQYSVGKVFPARTTFEKRVADSLNISESGVRRACKGQKFDLNWVKAHENDPAYQALSEKAP